MIRTNRKPLLGAAASMWGVSHVAWRLLQAITQYNYDALMVFPTNFSLSGIFGEAEGDDLRASPSTSATQTLGVPMQNKRRNGPALPPLLLTGVLAI